jgi:RsiW-degrading membrane proteinase PrsW (M82 family)
MSALVFAVSVLCYSSVSPRTLDLTEYNLQFFENIRITSLATIGPAIILRAVFDAGQNNDINSVINTFFAAATVGYIVTFVYEVIATTVLRLVVFAFLERDIFLQLTPKVPIVVLPWVLREYKYRPKRITLFIADFVTSCIAAPIVEEYAKLLLLQWTTNLPRYEREMVLVF